MSGMMAFAIAANDCTCAEHSQRPKAWPRFKPYFRIRLRTSHGQFAWCWLKGVRTVYDAWVRYAEYEPPRGWEKVGFEFNDEHYLTGRSNNELQT